MAHNLKYLILPALVILLIIFIFLTRLLIKYQRKCKRTRELIEGGHILVTGGSSGIGKHVAIQAAERGINVTIIGRDQAKLLAACEEIRKVRKNESQAIHHVSLDISKDFEKISNAISELETTIGPITILVNCAGTAICGTLEDMAIEDAYYLVNLNYLGTLHVTKALVPKMKQRKKGCIVITSSQAGLVGLYGYSVYSSTKFALRGFAEALNMEIAPYNMNVMLCLPPDTDTPGFENEEKSKPLETKLISSVGNLVSPSVVAKRLLSDALDGNFFSTVGIEGTFLTILCCGMAPACDFLELITQMILMGPSRLLGYCCQLYFKFIVNKCMKEKTKSS